jgi:hypothetical protein
MRHLQPPERSQTHGCAAFRTARRDRLNVNRHAAHEQDALGADGARRVSFPLSRPRVWIPSKREIRVSANRGENLPACSSAAACGATDATTTARVQSNVTVVGVDVVVTDKSGRPVRQLRIVLALLIALACSACYVGTHYQGWQYRGGQFTNRGLLTRPRYVAQFPGISINQPGNATYTFTRFPASDAAVILEMPSAPPGEAVRRLTTQLRIRIEDQNGRVVCEGSGSPQGRGATQIWVNSSAGAISLYHTNCLQLDLWACAPCRLQIWIGPVDPATLPLRVLPALHGGGWELP